jgi:hypothetical protein
MRSSSQTEQHSTVLRELELELQAIGTMQDEERLNELLADQFVEYGRSGRTYDKEQIIQLLLQATESNAWSQDFNIKPLSDQIALVTYRSAHLQENGTLERHTLRSSVWIKGGQGWQLLFHQGTATVPFERAAT